MYQQQSTNLHITHAAVELFPATHTSSSISSSNRTRNNRSPDVESLPSSCSEIHPQSPPQYTNSNINEINTTVLANSRVTINNGGRTGLPTYDEAINPEAPPPSYDSLFGRMREARKTSNGIIAFFMNVVIILLGTIGCTIIIGMTIVIPICMVVFGTVYLNDCTQSEYIPVYLLVGGIFGIIKQLLHLSARVRSVHEQAEERLRQSPTHTLINCFMLGWFIIGSYWVYKEYEPNYDPVKGRYCNKSLYLFAFWLITSVYIFLGLVTVFLCSTTIVASIIEPTRQNT